MNVSIDNPGYKVFKKIYKGCWMQGAFVALKAFFNTYHMISGGDSHEEEQHPSGGPWQGYRPMCDFFCKWCLA